ncbi:hypothetical protein ACLSZU_03275 [Avibacterium avium]|uniref:hypothetical protein n=1 Tax=Avibacterium avium TaxID=751 RepID=UPI003BF814BA
MQTNLVKVRVKPEYQNEFAQIVKNEMQIAMDKENGVWLMAAGTEKNAPNHWLFLKSMPMPKPMNNTAKPRIFKHI